MSLGRSHKLSRNDAAVGARGAFRDRFLLGLAVFALARAGEALAGEAAPMTAPIDPESSASKISAFLSTPIAAPSYSRPLYSPQFDPRAAISEPGAYPLPAVSESPVYSSKDFRPRGRSVYDVDPHGGSADDNLTFDKTIWQRLSEYRTRDRVRVLTLWESGVSAVSLQTDRKGDPWLQFTSKLNSRGNATHGLLDRLLPVTSFTANGMRGMLHPGSSSSSGKSSKPFSVLHFGSSATP
jgi:hypothetical protein